MWSWTFAHQACFCLFFETASSSRRSFSGSTIRQRSIQRSSMARWIWCAVSQGCASTLRFGQALALEICPIAAVRWLLHTGKYASSEQFCRTLSDELCKSAGRINAAAGNMPRMPAESVATSPSERDSSQPRLRKNIYPS